MTGPNPPGPIDPDTEPLPPAAPRDDAPGRVLRAVPYAVRAGYRPLLLDLHLPAPEPAEPPPVVVFLHGGGWSLGDRTLLCPTWRNWRPDPFARIAASGFAVAAVDYRLSGEATFPAQLDDVTAAVRWLHVRAAELGVDADRIVAWGESAGGHLAALLGLTTTRTDPGAVVGVVDWYGPADLTTLASQSGPNAVANPESPDSREAGLIGAPPRDCPRRARAASPVTHVHAAAPPFHLAHGTADRFVPAAQSRQLTDALRRAGVHAELDLITGADHLWQHAPDPDAVLARALDFATHVTR